ncbi:hypothetical protein PCANC_15612 [Puccinia coronata f. sp. avenae]|uniref:Uncharacterized protein n=1 Tax=Puccinia coronata f. sp. avenae TaxID=200324 RepID=A0A2N5SJV0_9BASI|nr:hypothetical protein PCANC_15612 [Puccinia coronata f. sp. avenae]
MQSPRCKVYEHLGDWTPWEVTGHRTEVYEHLGPKVYEHLAPRCMNTSHRGV